MLSRGVSFIGNIAVATKEKPNFSAGSDTSNPINSDHDGCYLLIVDEEYDVVELIRQLFERDG